MQRRPLSSSKARNKRHYPLYLDLEGKKVYVIGGGKVAERKVLSLLESGADVTVISPSVTERLKTLSQKKQIRYIPRPFRKGDLKCSFLAVISTGRKEINRSVAKEAKLSCCLYNVADDPEVSNFIVPSTIKREKLTIAISTGGISPALSKKIRMELEKRYGKEYGIFLNLIEGRRKRLMKEIPSESIRRRIFQKLVDSGLPEIIKNKGIKTARIKAEEIINKVASG